MSKEAKTMTKKQKLDLIDKELLLFKDYCQKMDFTSAELKTLYRPLTSAVNKLSLIRFCVCVGVLLVFCLLIYYVPYLNWHASAIGRIIMISLLPYWEWDHLYNARCLVDGSRTVNRPVYHIEPVASDCSVCEALDYVDVINYTTNEYLQRNYYSRSAPFIIGDSHEPTTETQFLKKLSQITSLTDSFPCETETNLLFGRADVHTLIDRYNNTIVTNKFLYFENCFAALKASRLMIPKPYFQSSHLPPAYSSWFLLSHNYTKGVRHLPLDGFVTFYQMSGRFRIELEPRGACAEICPSLPVVVDPGQALVWTTELWDMQIESIGENNCIAAITVTDGNP